MEEKAAETNTEIDAAEIERQAKLAEVRRRAAAAAARRAKRAESNALPLEERDMLDKEAIDALEEKHGAANIRCVTTSAAPPLPGVCVILAPSGKDYRAWRAVITSDRAKTAAKLAAAEDLAKSVVIYPEEKEYAAICARHPGTPAAVAQAAVELAGAVATDMGKD